MCVCVCVCVRHVYTCMTCNVYNKRVLNCILPGRFMAENEMFPRKLKATTGKYEA